MNFKGNQKGIEYRKVKGMTPTSRGWLLTKVIKGIQSKGIIVYAKHYVRNNQEINRKNSSSKIKEQAL